VKQTSVKQTWAAPERNKQPILDVLTRVLPARCSVLEIASGSGQHAVFFASQRPEWTWQPSDIEDENLASIDAWVAEAQLPNLRAPLCIDVTDHEWGVGVGAEHSVQALFCANMIHIAPWAACEGLIDGAGRYLVKGGKLVLYGPFSIGGQHTSESNATFDASLKARDPSWGVRDVDEVSTLATRAGLVFVERVAMPANNQCVIFEKKS
jgi:hypothetical protein